VKSGGIFDKPVANKRASLLMFVLIAALGFLLFSAFGWHSIFWGADRSNVQWAFFLLIMALGMMAPAWIWGPISLRKQSRAHWILFAVILGVATLLAAYIAYGQFVAASDEYAYDFEAKTFAHGRLWNPYPPLGQAMSAKYAWAVAGKWVGQYPPGWPAILALCEGIGLPRHFAGALLIVAIALLVAALTRLRAGRSAGWCAALLFAISPFSILTGASLLSHAAAAAFGIAAVFCSRKAAQRQSLAWALLAGATLGLIGITRPVAAMVIAPVIFFEQALSRPSRKAIYRIIAIGCGGTPFAAILMAYQYAITGNPLKPVYWIAGRDVDHLYFDVKSISLATKLQFFSLLELSSWVCPIILFMWVSAIYHLSKSKKISASDFVFPLGVLIFCFYPLDAGVRFGPRYLFDFWPMAVVTICSAVPVIGPLWRPMFRHAIAASILYGAAMLPLLVWDARDNIQTQNRVYAEVLKSRLEKGVVCLAEPQGKYIFNLSSGNFAQNKIEWKNGIVYVNCAAVSSAEIHNALPGYPLWIYRGGHLVLAATK
jgi:hypothetical protein